MSKHIHHPEKKKGFPLLKLALGAALAAGAGYYATHKEEVDAEAKKRINELAKIFKEQKVIVEKKVKKVWGEVSKEAIAAYMDVRGQLLHALEKENVKKQGKMLRSNYDAIVADIIKRARKSGVLNAGTEKNLSDLFSMDWQRTQKVLSGLFKKAKVTTKARVIKKTAKAKKAVVKKPAAKKAVAKKPASRKAKRK